MVQLSLVVPAAEHLSSYTSALERGWSPNTVRGEEIANEQLAAIRSDASKFLASLDDPQGRGAPIVLPDGTFVPRLPSLTRWIWDGQFCGTISLRWQPGTSALPPHVLGHIGYAVVPWKRRKGCATFALSQILPEARRLGLAYLEVTTDANNRASQKVILANKGRYIERFNKPATHRGGEGLRFRIDL